MYKSYFKIGWRNMLRQRVYSAINIGGLTIGLTSFILVLLYVQHELTYDQFHKNADRLFLVYQQQSGNVYMGSDYFSDTPTRLASIMRDELPEVETATAVTERTSLVSFEDKNFFEKGLFADSHFLEVFSFKMIKGNPQNALSDPKAILLTETFARKIFGDTDPMGKLVKYGNDDLLIVTGILADLPTNSSFQFSYVTNIAGNSYFAEELSRPTWNGNTVLTFFMLKEGGNTTEMEKKFPSIISKYRDEAAYKNYPFVDRYLSMPLKSLHLTSGINMDMGVKGNKTYVYLFSIVAFIILLLACVNYMNLAIVRSINRAREVGLRKAVGALKRQLIGQFLGESIFIAFLSLVLAVGLCIILLPFSGYLTGRTIELNVLENTWLIPGLFLTVVLVGVFSGSYPALVMSALKPIEVLRGKISGKIAGFRLQRVLIVVQYAASIVMLIGSLVIYRQIEFMRSKDLGYNRENIITIPTRDKAVVDKFEALKNEWQQYPGVISTSISSDLPTQITSGTLVRDEDGSGPEDDVSIYLWRVDGDFMAVFGIELVAGTDFREKIAYDEDGSIILNETAAKVLGWSPQEAVGKQIFDNRRMNTIVGVVRDFHMHSMHLAIQPLMIRHMSRYMDFISVKVDPKKLGEVLPKLESSVGKISPYPFDFRMLDDHYNRMYESENKLGEVFGSFTILAILIASLGLFGLAAFTSAQRTKEVGIRKVLGASVQSITILLSKDFMKLVVVAFVVSAPVAWYLVNDWLQEFAYRTNIDWTLFALAAILMLFIANVAIAYQSIKTAVTNPVTSLKSE